MGDALGDYDLCDKIEVASTRYSPFQDYELQLSHSSTSKDLERT